MYYNIVAPHFTRNSYCLSEQLTFSLLSRDTKLSRLMQLFVCVYELTGSDNVVYVHMLQ